jgi:hypothetical protein
MFFIFSLTQNCVYERPNFMEANENVRVSKAKSLHKLRCSVRFGLDRSDQGKKTS